MKKESVNKFDLEAAFKALEEIEVPVVKGIKPNRENLQEKFTKKSTTEVLVEDYFDVNDQGDLEAAQEEREAEIAKAKLARIEKIVDLDAESEEDLLPSYVGKFIIQCPQCMTLFYKNQEDIEKSEENPEVVNINEVCQHCGNTSGYTLIGKVDNVGEEEAENYDVEDFDENELNLDFDAEEEPVEEESTEEEPVEDETAEEGNEEEIELEPVEETEEENSEEEEVKESLNETSVRSYSWAQLKKDAKELFDNLDVPQDLIPEFEIDEEYGEDAKAIYMYFRSNLDIDDFETKYWSWIEKTEEFIRSSLPEISAIEISNIGVNSDDDTVHIGKTVSVEKSNKGAYSAIVVEFNSGSLTEALPREPQVYDEKGNLIKVKDPEVLKIWDKVISQAEADGITSWNDYKVQKEIIDKALTPDEIEKLKNVEFEDGIVRAAYESLTEAVDKELDDKLKAHNEYIEYLKDMIEKEEKSLASAKNDFVKKSIQSRIDALQADLEAALPEALKGEVETELPTAEEVELEATENTEEKEEAKESLKESLNEEVKIISDLSDYTPWSGAVDTWKQIQDADKVDELDSMLEEIYPDGLTMTELNDILWFDSEWVLSSLGIIEEVEESLAEDTAVKPRIRHQSRREIFSRELAAHPAFEGISTRDLERYIIDLYLEDDPTAELDVEQVVEYIEDLGWGKIILDNIDKLSEGQVRHFAQKDPVFVSTVKEFLGDWLIPNKNYSVGALVSELLAFLGKKPADKEEAKDFTFDPNDISYKELKDDLASAYYEAKKLVPVGEALVSDMNLDNKVSSEEVEELKEAGDLNTLLDSEEFKKPISEAEVENILAKYESLEEEIEPGIESELAIQDIVDTWESVEEIDEESLDKLTENYLTEVYSNVKSFKTIDCSLAENKLVVEGKITFNSGKTKNTKFIYEATKTDNNKVVLEGLNADFATEKAFVLNCNLDTANRLVVESLNYKYTINNTLVEGLTK